MAKRSYTSPTLDSDQAPPDFELDGETFVCHGQLSIMDISELGRLASQGVDSETPEGVGILADLFVSLLGDQTEYQRFRMHCRAKAVPAELLMQIVGDMIGDLAERPTSRPSSSPDGPPTTEGTAKVVSLSRGTVETVPAETLQESAVRQYG